MKLCTYYRFSKDENMGEFAKGEFSKVESENNYLLFKFLPQMLSWCWKARTYLNSFMIEI